MTTAGRVSTEGLGARLVSGARTQLTVMAVALAIGFLGQAGIGRYFGLEGLGEYAAVTVVLNIAALISLAGAPIATSRLVGVALQIGESGAAHRLASTGLALTLAASGVIAGILLAAWDEIASTIRLSSTIPSIVVAGAVPFGALQTFGNQMFQATLHMRRASVIVLVQPLTVVSVLVTSMVLSSRITPGMIVVAADVVGGITALMLLMRAGYRPVANRIDTGRLLRESQRLAPAVLGAMLFERIDRLLVAVILGTAPLGVYQAAATLVDASVRALDTARWFLVPVYGRLAAETSTRLLRLQNMHVRLWSAYGIVPMCASIAAAGGLVTAIYGEGARPAADPLRVLSLSLAPLSLTLALFTAFAGTGRVATPVVTWLSVGVQVLAGAALATSFGLLGATSARVATVTLSALAFAVLSVRAGASARPLLRVTFGWILGSAGSYSISLLQVDELVKLLFGSLIGVTIALVALGSEERDLIRRMARIA